MTVYQKILVGALLVILGVLVRLTPHAWNVAPVAAAALFAGAYLGRRFAVLVPLLILVTSDLILGGYEFGVMVAVYISFLVVGQLGVLIGRYKNVETILAGSLISSTLFFLATNWAHWQFTGMYAPTVPGLIDSYYFALPFFRNTVVGDLLYTGALFGAWELATHVVRRLSVGTRMVVVNE